MNQPNPLLHLTSDAIDAAWPRLAPTSDRALVEQVMEVLADPPAGPADSFVLHAPLELMARAELLTTVRPAARDTARRRIVEIATQWNEHAPHLDRPPGTATLALAQALAAGNLDATDAAVVALAHHATVDAFVAAAADTLLAHLGGAAHQSIYLDQLSRFPRPPRAALLMSRALLRDLARRPDWTLRWIDTPFPERGNGRDLLDVLADPPQAGDPGSNFIYPTMHLVDEGGLAAELLAAPVAHLPVDEARRQLLRVAAMSMLQDDPANAPYGWSHCLTMPQATLALAHRTADPRRAVAIAATYVLGFRATQSTQPIDVDWRPARPSQDAPWYAGDTAHAAASAWHADEAADVEQQVSTYAACHQDAHLAKYTLACLHAAHDDPDAAPLFRAAAAYLARWWQLHDEEEATPTA